MAPPGIPCWRYRLNSVQVGLTIYIFGVRAYEETMIWIIPLTPFQYILKLDDDQEKISWWIAILESLICKSRRNLQIINFQSVHRLWVFEHWHMEIRRSSFNINLNLRDVVKVPRYNFISKNNIQHSKFQSIAFKTNLDE